MKIADDRPLILIIESKQDTANALSMLLEDWGFSYVVADSAGEAILVLGSRLKDIEALITDYDVGDTAAGIGGAITVANAIGHPVPTLVITGFTELAEHLEPFPVLSKPFDPSRLHQWLRAQLQGGETHPA